MNFPVFQNLTTQRLRLRKIRKDDTLDFFRFAGSDVVTKYMLWKTHQSIQESEASIEKTLARYSTGRYYRWGIECRDCGTLIGIIDLLGFDEQQNICSFAYMLAESFWGRGFGTEALTAVLDFAFTQMGVDAVEADHFAENVASGAVMRKAGMTYIRTQPQKYEKNGIRHDAPLYRIDRHTYLHNAQKNLRF